MFHLRCISSLGVAIIADTANLAAIRHTQARRETKGLFGEKVNSPDQLFKNTFFGH